MKRGALAQRARIECQDQDSQWDKFLTFQLARQDYGIEIRRGTEIIGIHELSEVPDLPDDVLGVVKLRGEVIPVIDVRARLRLPARPYDARTCIVVVNVDAQAMGLVVDQVNEVSAMPPEPTEPPYSLGRSIYSIGRDGEEFDHRLDLRRLLCCEELALFCALDGLLETSAARRADVGRLLN